jgi:SAM-dependent methyltransferase
MKKKHQHILFHDESSYLNLPNQRFYRKLYTYYQKLAALTNPIWWLLDKRTKTVLDVGCGQGYPMQLLRIVRDVEATGVDLFDEYLKEAKKLNIYTKLVKADVTKLPFKDKSFDSVICLQVIEHLPTKKGLKLLQDLERIAKYQVIVTTPLGFCEHPHMDNNELQEHHSGWDDNDFIKQGYSIKHQSLNVFFGNNGVVHKKIPKVIKAAIFGLDKALMPLFFVLPKLANYWIIAYKKVDSDEKK